MIYVIYFGIVFILEMIMKLVFFKEIDLVNSMQMILFLMFISLIMATLGSLFKKKINKGLLIIYATIVGFFFSMQLCIKDIFKSFFSLHLFGAAGQVMDFTDEIITLIKDNFFLILIMFIPLILIIVFRKSIEIERISKRNLIINIVLILVVFGVFNLSLLISKKETYSSYNLVYNINDINLSTKKLGVTASFYLDLIKYATDFKESINLVPNKVPGEVIDPSDVVYEPNIVDYDFDSIVGDKTVSSLNEYFKADSGTLKNEYTGMFEGKNLIFFMAETFNGIVVDPVRTPTLYKLVNNGFNFKNFYSPTIYSTLGGEFQELSGLYPASGFINIFKSGENSFPYGIANVFEDIDYKTYAYHDNTYTFQNRYLYLDAFGFDNFKACKNGLEKLMDCTWLASDKEMIDVTFDEYAKSGDKFMTFYATVSGHGDYYLNGEFTKKYVDLVDDSLSEGIRSYLAAQIELDRALELLINKLEDKGILDDTVIVLAGDHHPYYLEIEEINEASSYKKDKVIEVDRSNLIIYNSEMDKVTVDKVGSQIDIIPTVYNLFGINYDSRMFAGRDILSSTPGVGIFQDRSWVSDYGRYYAASGRFELKEGKIVDENYVDDMNALVSSRINLSSMILKSDYYKYLK